MDVSTPTPTAPASPLRQRMLDDMRAAIRAGSGGEFHYAIRNSDRSIGARVSGEIARVHGNLGMSTTPISAA